MNECVVCPILVEAVNGIIIESAINDWVVLM